MKTILAVDDSVINLKAIKRLLSDRYKVIAVSSAADALLYLKAARPDLILLDVLMPEMDGFQMMEIMKENPATADIPVIFLTADNDKEKELKGFRMGAMDFIVKPFEPDIVLSRIEKTIELENLRHNLEREVILKTKEIEKITLQSVMSVANTVDSKDKYTKGHSVKVAKLSEELARRMGWDDERIMNIHYIALLHDIGKIGIPDNLIGKPGRYTKEEYGLVKRHTIIGADILENISIKNAKVGAKYHHEWYNGKGYNEGLEGDAIPIEARVIAVADAYDAMASDRSYRKCLKEEDIVKEFTEGRGTQFDPVIADTMLAMIEDGTAAGIISHEIEDFSEGIVGESASLLQKVMTEYAVEAQTEAYKDPLTGLWNRKYSVQAVDRLLSQPDASGTAFMIDLDNFKAINDNYGHIVGDEVLASVAKVLMDIVRQSDIACRIGGDEFFLYFNDMDNTATVHNLAARLIKTLNEKVKYPDHNRGMAASVGIAIAPKDGDTFEKLYSNADKALYHAKNNGKNVFHFFSDEADHCITADSIQEDLDYIRKMLSEQEPIQGSYYVEYEGFKNISRFIRRSLVRKDQEVVYILFTITGKNGKGIDVDSIPEMMTGLEGAIKDSLRVGDVATRYSSTQMVVILTDTDSEKSSMIANRIFADYIKRIQIKDTELHYDIQKLDAMNDK